MVYIIRDIQNGFSIPLYVGRGLSDYSHGRRSKGWSRIDIHKSQLQKTRGATARGEQVPNKDSLYESLIQMEQAGSVIDFQVIFETDDNMAAVIKEAETVQALRVTHPNLLNVTNVAGSGDRPRRVVHKWTEDQKRQHSERMTGKTRGPYILTDAGKESRIRTAHANRKCYNLPPEQHHRRRLDKAAVNRKLRLGQMTPEEGAVAMQAIDAKFLPACH